ncbi:hypothetical protein PQR72_32655, partial [Paraburkholderia madseniana]|uniref:hypothetical protein n=1 Tax=Paraburkholderia madseniana TaxID=2599607 RepID=UPI0038B7CD44
TRKGTKARTRKGTKARTRKGTKARTRKGQSAKNTDKQDAPQAPIYIEKATQNLLNRGSAHRVSRTLQTHIPRKTKPCQHQAVANGRLLHRSTPSVSL